MTFDLVFALTGTAAPGAVGGEPVEQVIEADLRAAG
jgi:hypothetical protein